MWSVLHGQARRHKGREATWVDDVSIYSDRQLSLRCDLITQSLAGGMKKVLSRSLPVLEEGEIMLMSSLDPDFAPTSEFFHRGCERQRRGKVAAAGLADKKYRIHC